MQGNLLRLCRSGILLSIQAQPHTCRYEGCSCGGDSVGLASHAQRILASDMAELEEGRAQHACHIEAYFRQRRAMCPSAL